MVLTTVLLLHIHLALWFFCNMVVVSIPMYNIIRQVLLSVTHTLQFQSPMKQSFESIWDQHQHASAHKSNLLLLLWCESVIKEASTMRNSLPPQVCCSYVNSWELLNFIERPNLSKRKLLIYMRQKWYCTTYFSCSDAFPHAQLQFVCPRMLARILYTSFPLFSL